MWRAALVESPSNEPTAYWTTAQLYQQLAAVHRAAEHDGEVRRILTAQRRDQIDWRTLTRRAERG